MGTKDESVMVRPREIKLNLSDADCERLAEMAGKGGLTVAELLENFIGDLVDGTHSNGSDEQMYAEQWYDRCWFGMFPEKTFLFYLLEEYEMDNFQEALKRKKNDQACMKEIKDNLSNPGEKWKDYVHSGGTSCYSSVEEYKASLQEGLEEYQSDLKMAEEMINDIWGEFLSWTELDQPDMAEEIEIVLQWQRELEKLKYGKGGENE